MIVHWRRLTTKLTRPKVVRVHASSQRSKCRKVFYAIRRAETGTGADYYVAAPGKGIEDLEDCWRLEISGMNKGNDAAVERLLNRKVEQTRRGNSNLPALAGVMGFEVLRILIEYVNDK